VRDEIGSGQQRVIESLFYDQFYSVLPPQLKKNDGGALAGLMSLFSVFWGFCSGFYVK